jgi:hypothetical protein
MFEYRRDGWPLCPVCGDDELMSMVNPVTSGPTDPLQVRKATATDPMTCLSCGWQGRVPARDAVAHLT